MASTRSHHNCESEGRKSEDNPSKTMSNLAQQENQVKPNSQDDLAIIKPTVKRYFILLMYGICSMEKSFQWINLSTITNKVAFYYGVDNIAVNWTSVLFMITFIPLVLPTGWLIGRIGLRKAILIGSFGIGSGAVIKCFGCNQDDFYIIILGQIVVSLSEQFIFCVPARIASVWFPDNQVSIATGFGIFGNQCGIALGFLIPQAILDGLETREEIGGGLYTLFLWTAIVSIVTLAVLIVFFDDHPEHAPGAARLRKIREEQEDRACQRSFGCEMKLFYVVLRELIKQRDFKLLIVAYGINVGSGYAIQTLLNQMITRAHWDDANQIVGVAGLLVIFCGMVGAIFWGHLCDLTRKYLLITKVLYLGAILSMALFGLTLSLRNVYLLYIIAGLLGFHLIGYTVVGLDTTVEITYPAPELVSTSMMNLSPQIFGTAITFASSALVDAYDTWAIYFLLGVLTLGFIFNLAIRASLNRQAAVVQTESEREKSKSAPGAVVEMTTVNAPGPNPSC